MFHLLQKLKSISMTQYYTSLVAHIYAVNMKNCPETRFHDVSCKLPTKILTFCFSKVRPIIPIRPTLKFRE